MIHLPRLSGLGATPFGPALRTVALPGATTDRVPALPRGLRVGAPKGLSIIEVLVALAFLAVFAAGITGLAVAILKGNAKSQSTDTAVYLALDQLETLRNKPYASVSAGSATEDYGTITVAGQPYADFQRTTEVTDDMPQTGMKRVVVTVRSRRGSKVVQEMIIGQ
jgi:Tfp pilus assembly protein PilV